MSEKGSTVISVPFWMFLAVVGMAVAKVFFGANVSWWVVLCPLWVPVAAAVLVTVVVAAAYESWPNK